MIIICGWVGGPIFVNAQAHLNVTGEANNLRHIITPNAIKSPTPNTVRIAAMPSRNFRHGVILAVREEQNVFNI